MEDHDATLHDCPKLQRHPPSSYAYTLAPHAHKNLSTLPLEPVPFRLAIQLYGNNDCLHNKSFVLFRGVFELVDEVGAEIHFSFI